MHGGLSAVSGASLEVAVWVVPIVSSYLACHKGPDTESAPVLDQPAVLDEPAPPPAPAASSEESMAAVIRALSARDGDPSCTEVEALVSEPVPVLLQVVETVEMPPMAPMRAASCLLEGHAVEVADTVVAWMNEPGTLGLALLVADRLDKLPPDLAKRAATAGLGGPHAVKVRERIAGSPQPEVRALLGP